MYLAVCEPTISYSLESTSHVKYVLVPYDLKGPSLEDLAKYAGEHVGNVFSVPEAEKNYAILKNVFRISLDKGTAFCAYDDLLKKASQIFSGSYNGSDSGLGSSELTHVETFPISGSSSGSREVASGITSVGQHTEDETDFDGGFDILDGV